MIKIILVAPTPVKRTLTIDVSAATNNVVEESFFYKEAIKRTEAIKENSTIDWIIQNNNNTTVSRDADQTEWTIAVNDRERFQPSAEPSLNPDNIYYLAHGGGTSLNKSNSDTLYAKEWH